MMQGFNVMLGREVAELLGTWKARSLPVIIVLLGVLSPVIAWLQPSLGMPKASTVDAYLHFSNNLIQVILMGIVISVAGVISAERRSGTALLMLTKPMSRTSFVLAKVVTKSFTVIVSGAVGAVVCWSVSQLFFTNVMVSRFIVAVALWMVLAVMVVSVMTLFSVTMRSQAGATGAGFALYLALALFTQWSPALHYSPVGLMTLGGEVLASGSASVIWQVGTAAMVTVIASVAAIALFRRQEL